MTSTKRAAQINKRKTKISTKEAEHNEQEMLNREFEEIQQYINTQNAINRQHWGAQRVLLAESLKVFENIRRGAMKAKIREKEQQVWDASFKMDGLPHTFRPNDVLNYISKWKLETDRTAKVCKDWGLRRDERSILTQDESICNRTLNKLKDGRVEEGHGVAKQMQNVEYVLNGIRKETHLESSRFTVNEKAAMRVFRNQIHKNMARIIDIYTNHLLQNGDRELRPMQIEEVKSTDTNWGLREPLKPKERRLDFTCIHHSFSHELFFLFVWTFRDVPQPPRTEKNRFKMPLASFGGEASIPYASQIQDLAFRSHWTYYDHFSVHCPNYSLQNPPPPVSDLLSALVDEWSMKNEIDQANFEKMQTKHNEFQEVFRTRKQKAADRETQGKKSKTMGTLKKSTRKMRKMQKQEKLSFGPAEAYNSRIAYVVKEDLKYAARIDDMRVCEKTLAAGDVNLRSHQILGGVFHLEFIPKPVVRAEYSRYQLTEICSRPSNLVNFQTITLDKGLDESSIISRKVTKESPLIEPGRESTKPSPSENVRRNEAQTRRQINQPDSPEEKPLVIEFKLQLSPHVMWWLPPVVCYWEPWEYSEQFENLPEGYRDFYRNYDQYVEKLEKRLLNPKPVKPASGKVVPDFDMQNIPSSVDFQELCQKFIIPALPYHYQTYIDTISDRKEKKELERMEKLRVGFSDSDFRTSIEEKEAPVKSESLPPTPLFFAGKDFCSNVCIVTSERQEGVILQEEHAVVDRSDNFNPPNLTFSEFYKGILSYAAAEESIFPKEEQEKLIHIIRKSGDVALPLVERSRDFMQKRYTLKLRRNKRSKSKLDSDKLKIIPEVKLSDDFLVPKVAEFRGSFIYGYTLHPRGRWTTKKITDQSYDETTKTITFTSPCFGAYGLAAYRYSLMPYKDWLIAPSSEDNNHVILNITAAFISLEIDITPQGYSLKIPPKSSIPIPADNGPLSMYDFKKLLCNVGLNIFPEQDAACYIADTVEKHSPMEYHIYFSMAYFCRSHRFKRSAWNRLSHRRHAIISVQNSKNTMAVSDVFISPNECYLVKISEECQTDLNEIKLSYQQHPPGQQYHPDLYYLLKAESMQFDVMEADESALLLMYNVQQLLWNIRPLSFS